MAKDYDHKAIEKKWQEKWLADGAFKAEDTSSKPKHFQLVEFPYPSGAGLHTGHARSYTAMDVVARKRRSQGYNVLYPIGWDAFGLPTENYAIKTGKDPRVVTKENTDTFRRQLQSLGFSFDWSREINTTDPKYYKWTQWIFLQMYHKGLAYKGKATINWCPKDKIGLANEEVVDGKCERCGTEVEKREKEQWMLAITKYAERLYDDLDTVDYIERAKVQQRNWIGKSEGAEIVFDVEFEGGQQTGKIPVFTTRPDTLFGATYMVLAPEHVWVTLATDDQHDVLKNKEEVKKYVAAAKQKAEMDRTAEGKEKTGVKIEGVWAINPATKEKIPLFVADYVLGHYGTGAVMGVPGHDERDNAFAKKYNLPIKSVVEPVFVTTEGEGAARPGEEFVRRNAVCIVVRNPKDNTYMGNSWKTTYMHGLFTGGVEDGEDMVEAARREIREETGYKNLKLIAPPHVSINTKFYHRIKKQNRWAHYTYVFFDLENEEREPVAEGEAALHEIVWLKKEELKNFFSVSEGQFLLNLVDNDSYLYTGAGVLADSGEFSLMDSEEAKKKITEFVGGTLKTTFKLRDWVFSRQRYWGEPIPMINCPDCGWQPVPEDQLPVTLPEVEKYEPTDNGESPLVAMTEWVTTTCPKCKGPAKRETDVMPNWAGSSWYYLRYTDPTNDTALAAPEKLKYWTPVDWYNGGMEHTVLHLLYSRFWHKFLFDIGVVPTSEPYQKRTSHGLILAEGGEKMSKSKGNTVNPDEIVETFGADSLRIYEMFMGPFDQAVAWSTDGLVGVRRFLERVAGLADKVGDTEASTEIETLENQTIKKVGEDIESMKFNTCVSQAMIFANALGDLPQVPRASYESLLKLLAPFAPHLTEELWHDLGHATSIHAEPWPTFDASKLVGDSVTIAVQVAGKLRGTLVVSRDTTEEGIMKEIMKDEKLAAHLPTSPSRVVFVPNKIINLIP